MAAVIVGTTAGIVGWRTVHRIAEQTPALVLGASVPAPAFASDKAATGLASEAASSEPLVSGDENR
jgi:hypothetical protein